MRGVGGCAGIAAAAATAVLTGAEVLIGALGSFADLAGFGTGRTGAEACVGEGEGTGLAGIVAEAGGASIGRSCPETAGARIVEPLGAVGGPAPPGGLRCSTSVATVARLARPTTPALTAIFLPRVSPPVVRPKGGRVPAKACLGGLCGEGGTAIVLVERPAVWRMPATRSTHAFARLGANGSSARASSATLR